MKKLICLLTPLMCFSSLVSCGAKTYKVTWKNYDGVELLTKNIEEGKIPEYTGITPTKDSDDFYNYTFSNWDHIPEEVHEDQIYVAEYSSEVDASITQVGINLPEGQNDFAIKLTPIENEKLLISWGDNTLDEGEIEDTYEHTYEDEGEHNILIKNALGVSSAGSDLQFKNLIESIKFGNTVTNIADSAFEDCHSLSYVDIPSSIKRIGQSSFHKCTSLENLNIQEGLESIGMFAFLDCPFKSINLPDSVTTIGMTAFSTCIYLESFVFPKGITQVSDNLLYYCTSLKEVEVSENVNWISNGAFGACKSLELVDMTKVKEVPMALSHIFSECDLSKLYILVPTSKLTEYRNKDGWSEYKDRIVDHLE